MTKLIQPTAIVQFRLPNGMALKAVAYTRMIKSSHRIDSKNIGIDWDTVYACIRLDSEKYGPIIIKDIDMKDEDAEHYLDPNLRAVATALGSIDYVQNMKDAMSLAVSKVDNQKEI